ncbi:MAG: hypothetical protein R3202_04250, partial [Candidatus Competibacterales bacterium]|nr:hypothetical protein [Candidatus Competibacterales bacterium]
YRVAINHFLLTGKEEGLAFLTPEHPQLQVLQEHADLRRAVIDRLRQAFPRTPSSRKRSLP